jgi:preprotein translocase subunit SecD
MYLGLDLRGGVHFLLQVDMKGALTKRLDSIGPICAADARQEHPACGHRPQGQTVQVQFRDAEDARKGARSSPAASPTFCWRRPGRRRLHSGGHAQSAVEKRIQDDAVKQNITTLHKRINELAVAEPVIQQQGADRIVVQLPGVQDVAKAKDISRPHGNPGSAHGRAGSVAGRTHHG